MPRPRTWILVPLLVVAACGASSSAIISRTAAGLDAGRAALLDGDAHRQADIVAHATSHEEGQRELATYRGRRDKVAAAFVAAYSALAIAAVEASDASLLELATTATSAVRALRELDLGLSLGGTP